MVCARSICDLKIQSHTIEKSAERLPLIVRAHLERHAVGTRRERTAGEVGDSPVRVGFAGALRHVLLAA